MKLFKKANNFPLRNEIFLIISEFLYQGKINEKVKEPLHKCFISCVDENTIQIIYERLKLILLETTLLDVTNYVIIILNVLLI